MASKKLIYKSRSLLLACDSIEANGRIIRETHQLEAVGGYKFGIASLLAGLAASVEEARAYTEKPLIYDHQKAGTDVPHTGKIFARLLREAGVDAAILVPRERDEETQRAWTAELQERDIHVIIGGELTSRQATPETEEIYRIAARQSVRDFVVPGNKPLRIEFYRNMLEEEFGMRPVFYAPGMRDAKMIASAARSAPGEFHAIVNRAIMKARGYRAAIEGLSRAL